MKITTLTANDRCDRCGAQAYVATSHTVDDHHTPLLWCHHHYREHEIPLCEHLVYYRAIGSSVTASKEPAEA